MSAIACSQQLQCTAGLSLAKMVLMESGPQKAYMRTPLPLGMLIGNIGCWGLVFDAPPTTPWESRVFVLVFLAVVTLVLWSYREFYFEDRVVARYLPYYSREVCWKEVHGFSFHPILRLRTPQRVLSLPGTSPLLQTFIQDRLCAIPSQPEDFRRSSRGALQLRYSSFWGLMFLGSVAATAPFLDGWPLHKRWDSLGVVFLLCDLHLFTAAVVTFGNTALYYCNRAAER